MRVNEESILCAVAGNVKLLNCVDGDAVYKVGRRKRKIMSVHIDVIDVEQQAATGSASEFRLKMPFAERRVYEADVSRDIFQHQWAL